ncbi:MAG: hypothetical protein M1549_00725 [Candidatus Dependentiae bacterium]|nr:hypothetical protein [Candidatus Dependentiae bacterium]
MKRPLALVCMGLIFCTGMSGAKTIKKLWKSVTDPIASALEASESAFYSREFDLPEKDGRIVIKNIEGSVALAHSKANKLFVEAEKRGKKSLLQSTHISVQTHGDTTTIETKLDKPQNSVSVYYTITVPESASVVVEQQSGDIWVRSVRCPISLQASESGSIHIEHGSNSVTARALQGSISLIQERLPRHANIFLEAHGAITVVLPDGANANLNAQTAKGLITSTIPITIERLTTKLTAKDLRNLRNRVTGTLGTGGASITLDATKGPIKISAVGDEG